MGPRIAIAHEIKQNVAAVVSIPCTNKTYLTSYNITGLLPNAHTYNEKSTHLCKTLRFRIGVPEILTVCRKKMNQ